MVVFMLLSMFYEKWDVFPQFWIAFTFFDSFLIFSKASFALYIRKKNIITLDKLLILLVYSSSGLVDWMLTQFQDFPLVISC